MSPIQIPRNAFQKTLAGLNYRSAPICEPDLFSRACVEVYETSDPGEFGYRFTQIFEPGVLQEVALLEGVTADSMETLAYHPTAEMQSLKLRLGHRRDLSVVERINLASVLISISRFDAAELARPETVGSARERFELAWVDFLISNRRDDGAFSRVAFSKMMAAIDEGDISTGRIVDVCTQGIVWYLKRREIDDAQYRWCIESGDYLVRRRAGLGSGTISSWYRGLAMVPAADRDSEKTRRYMTHAYDYAIQAAAADDYGALNSLKTYHESSMKEFMYIHPDLELAEQAGLALISMDEHWSPSYAELAAVYEHFGRAEKAAEYYEKAVAVGPPYVGHHLLRAARTRAKTADADAALRHYQSLNELAPAPNLDLCREALYLATLVGHPMRGYFQDAIEISRSCRFGA
jgi:hypothetical protein